MGIIKQTIDHVKSELSDDASGHDWWHIYRVWKSAKRIARAYNEADILVVELAALLHDIADWKDNGGDVEIGPKTAENWLSQFDEITEAQISNVYHIIRHMSFKGANVKQVELSIEGKIVQDADRLDAIGAIGIARTFAYGATVGNIMYDPSILPKDQHTSDAYLDRSKTNTTINHFYEKLLLLKDQLNTEEGRSLAEARHQFMEMFLERFYQEWEGEE